MRSSFQPDFGGCCAWVAPRIPLQLPEDSRVCYTRARAGAADASAFKEIAMAVDAETVRRIAHLARIAVADDEVEHLRGEINAVLAFVEQLSDVNVQGVEPMTSVTPMAMKKRADVVTAGDNASAVLRNAPATDKNYFLVPKVVE
jgi:aspartyl-tRNA(Asn)/glutamyl-tRNA(Gln) amidotransferase subunit C